MIKGGAAVKVAASTGVVFILMAPAMAEPAAPSESDTSNSTQLEEIVITARKREESVMQSPVVVQVITEQQVQDLHLTSVESLQSAVPELKISPAFGLSSSAVTLRGIGNGNEATYEDQSVSLSLDDFTFSDGMMYKQGLFDLAQVEVLKGPQSLFYGKSSSGGVIALHSADPTSDWQSQLTTGYEFNAAETDVSGFVSGPINDELGVRLAGYYNTSKGWLYNPNPDNPAHRLPAVDQDGLRGTIKFDSPDIGLRVKLKVGTTHDELNVFNVELQESVCPPGGVNPNALLSPYDTCTIGRYTQGIPPSLPYSATANFSPFLFGPTGLTSNPAFGKYAPDPIFGNGKSRSYTNSDLGILSIDYDLAQGLTVSSVTSYDFGQNFDVGASPNIAVGASLIGTNNQVQDFSQELRITSNWKGWFNFMGGALYTTQDRRTHLVVDLQDFPGALFGLPVPSVGLYTDDSEHMKGRNESLYTQILLTPIEHWELSAGVRYTYNVKYFTSLIAGGNYQQLFDLFPPADQLPPGGQGIGYISPEDQKYSQYATTPEVTLTYRPTDDLMAFLSYKQGYKGIGFNTNPATPSYAVTSPLSTYYNDVLPVGGEHVRGVEGGIKAQFLNRQLAVTATGYLYDYDNLQVSFIDAAADRAVINNGADARVQGIELGADYSVEQLRGLRLNAFLNYNDAYYQSFPFAGCYSGQSVEEGCLAGASLGQVGHQNLAGHPLVGAAKVVGSLGATYTRELSDNYVGSLQAEENYSTSYYPSAEENPMAKQGGYGLLDITAHLIRSDKSWDLALICRDCTDKYYIVFGNDAGSTLTGAPGGTNVLVARPRQILLELTVRPSLH